MPKIKRGEKSPKTPKTSIQELHQPKQPGNSFAFKLKKSYLIGLIVVVLTTILAFFGKNIVIAATVNGQPIYRLSIVSELEKQGGKQALDGIISETLIFQEARKKNVSVSEDEIAAEIKKIEDNLSKQGQSLDQLLITQGLGRDSLKKRITIQKLVEKLIGKDIAVSDKEVDEYIEKNKDQLPQDQDQNKLRSDIKEQLKQQKLSEKVQNWLTDLQKNSKINYFVSY